MLFIIYRFISGEIVFGGDVDVKTRYVSPTLVKNVALDDALMQEYDSFQW